MASPPSGVAEELNTFKTKFQLHTKDQVIFTVRLADTEQASSLPLSSSNLGLLTATIVSHPSTSESPPILKRHQPQSEALDQESSLRGNDRNLESIKYWNLDLPSSEEQDIWDDVIADPSSGDTSMEDITKQKNARDKPSPYDNCLFEDQLRVRGNIHMHDHPSGLPPEELETIRRLLNDDVELPEKSSFAEHRYRETLKRLEGRVERAIIDTIGGHICPSAEHLADTDVIQIKCLRQSIDESWISTKLITNPRPQPDFAVGFGKSAFTDTQYNTLVPYIGEGNERKVSDFSPIYFMLFPFLGCEAKRSTITLDAADRQNASSMGGVALRGVVSLFRLAKREHELDGKILAFSVSYNDSYVRHYAYYHRMEGGIWKSYRHKIGEIVLKESEHENMWKSYRLIVNIYQTWAPAHLKRLQSVLDTLSNPKPPSAEGKASQADSSSPIDYMTPDQSKEEASLSPSKKRKIRSPSKPMNE